MTGSPESSPIAETAPGPPLQHVSVGSTSVATSSSHRGAQPSSLYSRWTEEGQDELDEENEVFGTPSEGLSEVEEEDESGVLPRAANGTLRLDDAAQVEAQAVQVAALVPVDVVMPQVNLATPHIDLALDKTIVPKGTIAGDRDVAGTGRSTVVRSLPVSTETRVRQRAASRAIVAHVDQSSVLAQDIDTCRESLTLFLTSQMKEAEDILYERDTDGNRLYLQSASTILQALKVG